MENHSKGVAKNLKYAELHEGAEKKLREIEKQFNNEFGTDYFLMVMKEA